MKDKVWTTPKRTMHFLIWSGFVYFPKICEKCGTDSHYDAFGSDSQGGMHCFHRSSPTWIIDDEEGDSDEDYRPNKIPGLVCNKGHNFRQQGSILSYLATNIGPSKFIKALYWFSRHTDFQEAKSQCGIKRRALMDLFYVFRIIIFRIMVLLTEDVVLGGPGLVTCVDETFFIKRKINCAGFLGHLSLGQKTCVVGMVELDLLTRKETGRIVLTQIPRVCRKHLEKAIRKHIKRGSLVFTNKYKGYHWMSQPNSGYVHRHVNHSNREFSVIEMIFGVPVNVTSNPSEGLLDV